MQLTFLGKIYSVIKPFITFFLMALIMLLLSRSLLLFWQFERVTDVEMFTRVLMNGFRIDISSIAYLLFIPALIHPFALFSRYSKEWLKVLKVWFLFGFCLLLFFELATPAFITEYDLRPNRLFIEYLIYPKEVASMLFKGHLLEIVLSFGGLIIGGKLSWALLNAFLVNDKARSKVSFTQAISSFFILVIVLFACARGTVGHRPINPSLVYFSTDPLINSLTLNSAYSVAFAFKQMKNEKNAAKMYGKMPADKILRLVKQASELPESAYIDENIPTLALRQASYQGKPKNLVIVLEESLGAQFVGELGGLNLTPELDKIINSGWSLDQLYATGTRSVRGIEATITGFTPTPARAVVKLDKSQSNFFTIASLLSRRNYTTQFIYGGESHFDNMKSFFLGNGFNSIVDFEDIESPEYIASWGASDEDLFKQANKELTKLHKENKPFFSLIFTSSNHDPFDIPENKVTPIQYTEEQKQHYPEKEFARHKAIQYADYALGKFIKTAKEQAYYKNTVFLIVADHDARVYGSGLVPIKNFRIPGVILNSGFEHKRDKRVASNIDLSPTLLSLMGINDPTPMVGFDLTKTHTKERAIMQFANNFAYMSDKQVAILQPHKAISYYRYDLTSQQLISAPENKALGETALAHALFGSMVYEKGLFRLPKK